MELLKKYMNPIQMKKVRGESMKVPIIGKMKSIQNKFAFPVILLVIMILIASNFNAIKKAKEQYYLNLKEHAISTAELGSATLVNPLWNFNMDAVKDSGESLLDNQSVGYVEIRNSDDKQVFRFAKSDELYKKSSWIYVDKNIIKDNKKIGYIKIGVTRYFEQQYIKEDIIEAGTQIVIMSIILWSMIIAISTYVTKPIKKLKAFAEELSVGNLDSNINIETEDEIGEFAKVFNYMIDKLASIYKQLELVCYDLADKEEELRMRYDDLRISEVALRNSEERYRLALEGVNDAIWEWDLETGDFFASNKLYEITGYDFNGVVSLNEFDKFIYHEDLEVFRRDFRAHINDNSEFYKSEFRINKSDGSYLWVLSRGKALRDGDGKAIKIAGSISDITIQKEAEEKIKFMAFYDSLTKLPNRTLFMRKLDEEIEWAKRNNSNGAVFFIDLDNFKNINDTLGHNYGDKLLVYLSKKLKRLITSEDIICRLGGDEFLLIHACSDCVEMERYAKKLLDLFDNSFEIDNKEMYVTASIGIAIYPKDGEDSSEILKNADFAMYKAKELGKNRFAFYNESIYMQLERKTNIERILRNSIGNNELMIYYQPQYDANTEEIFGFEALLRLNSIELGFISPAEFIPIAEESRYISEIDLWILKEACLQCKEWMKKGYKFKSISVNVSSVDMQKNNFLENIKKILKETKISPDIIELEITETALMTSIDYNINELNELKKSGIRIALDDFGTGYSSLNYLRSIPINTLKIDKSFIDNITTSKKEESIMNNIIEMAHTMDLKVVAEGVETSNQLKILKEKRCDYIQGYYFSRPLPPEEIEKLLLKR